MAIQPHTLWLNKGLKLKLGRHVDRKTDALADAWALSWKSLLPEWEAAVNELVAMSKDGKWPNRRQIARAERVQKALIATYEELEKLAKASGGALTGGTKFLTDLGATGTASLIASQMPPGTLASVTITWDRVSKPALEKIVDRATQQITARHRPVAKETTQAIKQQLIKGIALGDNPNQAARQMVRQVAGQFEGGYTRARTIARTEMLDAYRGAALEQRKANTDVLNGWMWVADLSARTCSSCLAMHGQQFPPDEPGPIDHAQGRCTGVPVTKSWRDLGFDIDEPEPIEGNARDWFNDQPEDVQIGIMGKTKLDALNNGDIKWDQLAVKKSNPDWRDSMQPASLKDLGLRPGK